MRPGMTSRGPKRKAPLAAEHMTSTTIRLPASLIMWLDEQAVQMARAIGVASINRSDLVRKLLEDGSVHRAVAAHDRRRI